MGIAQYLSELFGSGRTRRAPETFIVSYPKSGRTWLRLLLGKVLCDQFRVDPKQMLDTLRVTCLARVTPTKFTHDGSGMREGAATGQLETDKSKYQGRRVVLLVRDPRDVMVSCYFQATKRIKVFDGPISAFVRDDRFGIAKCVNFYSNWGRNLHVPRHCLCVRYEEMHAAPQRTLQSVLDFMGVHNVRPGLLDDAVEFGRFDNMKKMEATGQFKRQVLTPGNAQDGESFKVRRGKVGGYTDYLSAGDCEFLTQTIVNAHSPVLDPYLQQSEKKVA